MRIISLLMLVLWCGCVLGQRKKITVDKRAAKEAYEYLLDFRADPQRMMRELGVRFDPTMVAKVKLNWNDALAKAAEARAKDMADRNYFDHSTPEGVGPNLYIVKAGYSLNPEWVKKKSANNFESIAANHPTAVDGMKAFIIGKGSPGFMHRKHVLGMDQWNGSLQDIGIGFVRVPEGATYKTYMSVIIAKHDW